LHPLEKRRLVTAHAEVTSLLALLMAEYLAADTALPGEASNE
jgi:hypothetical protein